MFFSDIKVSWFSDSYDMFDWEINWSSEERRTDVKDDHPIWSLRSVYFYAKWVSMHNIILSDDFWRESMPENFVKSKQGSLRKWLHYVGKCGMEMREQESWGKGYNGRGFWCKYN